MSYPPILTLEDTEVTPQTKRQLSRIRVGHNLTSVLNSPSPKLSVQYSFSQFFAQPDPTENIIPSVLAPVSLDDFSAYRQDASELVEVFCQLHTADSELDPKEQKARELLGDGGEAREIAVEELLNECFKRVPRGYFNEVFKLDFDKHLSVNTQTEALQLQQQLANWLDVVEVCLWKQTTSQADAFFNALSDLSTLRSQVAEACSTISILRKYLSQLRQDLVNRQLTVLQMKRRQENLKAVTNIAYRIKQVRSTIPTVDSLLAVSHDYGGALALIQEAKIVLSSELKAVKSLRTLARQLNDYEEMIAERLTTSFIDTCVAWDVGETAEKDLTLKPIVNGLLRIRSEQMHHVLEEYRQRVAEEVTTCAKNSVVEALTALDENTQDENVHALLLGLPNESFVSFLELVFYNLQMVMDRASQVHSTVVSIVSELEQSSRTDKLKQESADIVGVVCDLAQQSIKQLLKLRSEEHAKLRMEDFKILWDQVLSYCSQGDKMSSRKWTELRSALSLQAKTFLTVLHDKQKNSLYAVLDGEEWRQSDVPFEIQALVHRLVRNKPRVTISLSNTMLSKSKTSSKELVVNGRSLRVVSSVLMLITFLEKDLTCAETFTSLASNILSRVVELLRLFNERTNRLVLQAEACRTAGLKRINTKNLALACQSLTVVVLLLPFLKTIVGPHLAKKSQTHLDNEFGKIESEYKMHQSRIFAKFLEMIEMLLAQCCEVEMSHVDWDASTTVGLGKPQDYMTKLTHGITSMHNFLFKIMSSEQLQEIFQPIFDSINTTVPEYFTKVEPNTPTGRSRVRVDIKHLVSSLRRLRGLNGPGDDLDNFLAEKFGTTTVVDSPESLNGNGTQESES